MLSPTEALREEEGVASLAKSERPRPGTTVAASLQAAWNVERDTAGVWGVVAGTPDSYCPLVATMWPSFNEERWARRIAAAPELLAALKAAQHALITSQGLRATDLTPETFEAHIANGVARDRLEFTVDDAATLELIDAAIAKAEGQS